MGASNRKGKEAGATDRRLHHRRARGRRASPWLRRTRRRTGGERGSRAPAFIQDRSSDRAESKDKMTRCERDLSLTSFNNSVAPPKMTDSLTPIQAHLAKTPIEAGGAGHGGWIICPRCSRYPNVVRRGNSQRSIRPAASRTVRERARRIGRGGFRGDRAAARADGAQALLQVARQSGGRGRSVSGDFLDPGQEEPLDPAARHRGRLALRSGQPGCGAGTGREGAPPLG